MGSRYRPPPPPRMPGWKLATAALTPLSGLMMIWYSLLGRGDLLFTGLGVLTLAFAYSDISQKLEQYREYKRYSEKYPS
ncbi:hypothetical protein [Saccharothrix deserti]|uniref:hypothetical protein n=1 Tax=Saccharothrix deserti TaxID=2593674 RepID=UPI00131CD7F3|nr:hypothetical protein [Saccharothrix deserti]